MSAFAQKLLGDAEIERWFSKAEDLAAMVRFEMELAKCEAEHEAIDQAAALVIQEKLKSFVADENMLETGTAIDGVVVPELIRQMKSHVGEPESEALHFGATSQDVIDTSLILRLTQVIEILETRIGALVEKLDDLIDEYGDNPLPGRTRMQKAVSITAQDRLVNWKTPLRTHLVRLKELKPRLLQVQFGGAVGNLDKLGIAGMDVKKELAEALGVNFSHANWHTRRDAIAEFASWLSLITGSTGKIGQDICLMAQNDLSEIKLSGGGGSSAMPHKQNPVGAEILVTLARYNSGQLSLMHQALIHEQERSGAAWTLEWMVLPQMAISAGGATRTLLALLDTITFIGKS